MGFNIDTRSIEDYLTDIAKDYAEPRAAEFLTLALRRALSKQLTSQSMSENLARIYEIPPNAPGWLRQCFHANDPVYAFKPDLAMQEQIRHVADWIVAALATHAPWMQHCDEKGRPLKLLKLGSLEQAVIEADKAMRLANAKITGLDGDEAGHIETVMSFPDGSRIVRLLTAEALDEESVSMAHCIGNGAYDTFLTDGRRTFFSFRNAQGEPRATLDINTQERPGTLLQCRGYGNKQPPSKYLPAIHRFIKRESFKIKEIPANVGLLEQNGKYYDIHNLPENFHYRGDLNLSETTVASLPTGLRVDGWLNISLCKQITKLPEGLHVGNGFSALYVPITELPTCFYLRGDLNFRGTALSTLPHALVVTGNLTVTGTNLCELPEGLNVSGSLSAGYTKIKALPGSVNVGRNIYLDGSLVDTIPDDLHVFGDFSIRKIPLKLIPENLHVDRDLNITGTQINLLPTSLVVEGKIVMNRQRQRSLIRSRTELANQFTDDDPLYFLTMQAL